MVFLEKISSQHTLIENLILAVLALLQNFKGSYDEYCDDERGLHHESLWKPLHFTFSKPYLFAVAFNNLNLEKQITKEKILKNKILKTTSLIGFQNSNKMVF